MFKGVPWELREHLRALWQEGPFRAYRAADGSHWDTHQSDGYEPHERRDALFHSARLREG